MALKFLYITSDPFTNNSEEFVRILAVSNLPPIGAGLLGGNGILVDPNGNGVGFLLGVSANLGNSSTAYPYTFSGNFPASQIIIIPPGWTFKQFGRAIAVQGSLEEVLKVS